MIFEEQFESEEEFMEAEIPDPRYDDVEELAEQEVENTWENHVDPSDPNQVDPGQVTKHTDLHEEKLEEHLGRLPTREEMHHYLNTHESFYEHKMIEAGLVDSRKEARAW